MAAWLEVIFIIWLIYCGVSHVSVQRLVVKPDQLIKRRGKLGLVGVNLDLKGVKEWLKPRFMKETVVRTDTKNCLLILALGLLVLPSLCEMLLLCVLFTFCMCAVYVSQYNMSCPCIHCCLRAKNIFAERKTYICIICVFNFILLLWSF